MKISKIIRGIVGISVISGIAYAAYKYGEFNGENSRKQRNAEDEDFDFYDNEDEEFFAVREESENNSEEKSHEFTPFSNVKIDGISENKLTSLILSICSQKHITNKTIRDYFGIDFDSASDVLDALINAGYIGEMTANYRFPVLIKFSDYLSLTKKE